MDPRMWLRAIAVIPRLDRSGWDRLDPVARWLVAVRAAVLVMTVTSAGLAGLLCLRDGRFDGLRFALVLVGLTLAHATNNLVNDLTDHIEGFGGGDYVIAEQLPWGVVVASLPFSMCATSVLFFVALAFHHMRWFGGLFMLGVSADVVLHRI